MKIVKISWNSRDEFVDVEFVEPVEFQKLLNDLSQEGEFEVEEGFYSFDEVAYKLFHGEETEEEMLMWIVNYDRGNPIYEISGNAIYRLHFKEGVKEVKF